MPAKTYFGNFFAGDPAEIDRYIDAHPYDPVVRRITRDGTVTAAERALLVAELTKRNLEMLSSVGAFFEAKAAPPPPSATRDRGEERKQAEQKKTWLEIELVDEARRPIPNVRYRLRQTGGGSERRGTLNRDGKARVEGIDPVSWEVCFPDIDKREWGPA